MDKTAILLLFVLPFSAALLNPLTRKKFGSKLFSSKTDLDQQTVESLHGKTVILTGASSGLGKAMSLKLAECNLKRLIISGRNVEGLEEVKIACEGINKANKVHVLPCDLSNLDSVKVFAQDALEKCKSNVDVLILNGGMSSRSSFLETDVKVDQLLMNVNFLSGAAISKEIVPSMVEKKSGNIIWISSVQGKIGTPFRTRYVIFSITVLLSTF